jgi:PAS domain S-box-containing protein
LNFIRLDSVILDNLYYLGRDFLQITLSCKGFPSLEVLHHLFFHKQFYMHQLNIELDALSKELQKERVARLKAEAMYKGLHKMRHENPNPIMRFSDAGVLLSANAASVEIVQDFLNQINTPFIQSLRQQVQESSLTQKAIKTEHTFDNRYYLCHSLPVESENYVNVYFTDITDRKQVEERLRLLESVIMHAKDAFLITDMGTADTGPKIVFVNPAFTAATGYTPEEIIGQSPRLLHGPKTAPDELKKIQKALDSLKPVEAELIYYRKDGSEFHVSLSIVPTLNGANQYTHLVMVQRDMGAQKIADEKIRQSSAKNRAILETIPDSMFIIHAAGTILEGKVAHPQLFSFPGQVVTGENILHRLPTDLSATLSQYMKRVLDAGSMEIFEYALTLRQRQANFEFRLIQYREEELLLIIRDETHKKMALLQLQEQEQFIRQVIDVNPNYISVQDGQGHFLLANQAMAQLFETTLENINDQNMRLMQHNPNENSQHIQDNRQVIETLREIDKEEVFIKPNGEKVLMHTVKRPLHRPDGTVQVLGVATDITEIKKAKEELRERETLYRLLSENSRDIICLHDTEGTYLYVSSSAKEILGFEPENLLGLSPFRFFHPEENLQMRAQLEASLQEKQSVTATFRFLNNQGEYIWLESIIKNIRDEAGQVIHLQSTSRDITERKIAEEMLQQSEKKYRNLVHYSQAIICSHALDGRILSVNASLQRVLGFAEAEIMDKHLQDFIPISHRESFEAYLASFQNTTEKDGITCVISRSGKRRYLLSQAYKVEEAGTEAYVIAFAQDITDRLLAEHELKKAKIAAEDSARAKEYFLANMSHEIRTPMNGVIGMTGLLAKTPLNASQKTYLKNISTCAQNLMVIINDILDMAKIEAGKLSLEHIPFHLAESVKGAFQSQLYKAEEKDLRLVLHPVVLTNPMVIGDPYRLNQIILNLLSNAIKFTDKGQINFSIRIINESDHDVALEFCICDTGIGIPSEKQQSIFEGFTQAYASTTRQYGGTGLGLAICKRLVQQQGGQIWVESEINKGSAFKFVLSFPLAQEPIFPVNQPAEVTQGQIGKARILLAEDNEINQFLVQEILAGWGLEVTTANNGQEAVELYQQGEYDLVLMDIQMPLLNGVEATQQIRDLADPVKASVPIIALTANAIKGENEKYLAKGLSDYLSKPFEEEKLFNMLRMHLNDRHIGALAINNQVAGPGGSERQKPTIQHDLFDLGQLHKICSGDQAFFRSMLHLFLEIVPGYLRELRELQQEGNWPAIAAVSHKLKPNIDTMEILTLKEDIRQLENFCKKETDLSKVPALIDKVEMILHEVLEKIKEEVESLSVTDKDRP